MSSPQMTRILGYVGGMSCDRESGKPSNQSDLLQKFRHRFHWVFRLLERIEHRVRPCNFYSDTLRPDDKA